jgi:hypothetical protein
MKKVKVAAALVLSALSMSTFAATGSQTVNVTAVLTPVCTATAAPTLNFTYTAFQVGAQPVDSTGSVTFSCTRGGLAVPTVDFDGSTLIGTVAGLQYTLSVSAPTTNAGTAADTTTTGTATTYAYTIGGSMPGGQAGDKSLGTSVARTMTITY